MKNYIVGIVAAFLVLLAGFFIYQKLSPSKLPSNLIAGTGRMDGDIIALNTKYAGRIRSILIEEGRSVQKDDTIAILSSDEFEAKLKSIEGTFQSSRHSVIALQKEYEIASVLIPLSIEKARKGVNIAVAGKASLLRSIDNLKLLIIQDEKDYARTRELFEKELIEKHAFELAKLKLDSNTKELESLKEKLKQAQQKVAISKTDVKITQTQLKRLEALSAKIEAARSRTDSLAANKEELRATIRELTVRAPVNGVVIEKVARTGEVLAPGMVVATLIDPDQLYLKMFVDTVENGKIKLNDKAVIFLDAYPDMAIDATVMRIAQRAEFTPKEVNVKSDRIQRVYAVHLKPVTPDYRLKLGIPAVGAITIDGKGLPASSEILGDL